MDGKVIKELHLPLRIAFKENLEKQAQRGPGCEACPVRAPVITCNNRFPAQASMQLVMAMHHSLSGSTDNHAPYDSPMCSLDCRYWEVSPVPNSNRSYCCNSSPQLIYGK